MGWRYRKSIKILPGVRLNLNKKSRSISIGGKGFHTTFSSTGRVTKTVGIPGTGLYHTTSKTRKKSQNRANRPVEHSPRTYRVSSAIMLVLSILWFVMSLAVLSFSAWGIVLVAIAAFSFYASRQYRKFAKEAAQDRQAGEEEP